MKRNTRIAIESNLTIIEIFGGKKKGLKSLEVFEMCPSCLIAISHDEREVNMHVYSPTSSHLKCSQTQKAMGKSLTQLSSCQHSQNMPSHGGSLDLVSSHSVQSTANFLHLVFWYQQKVFQQHKTFLFFNI